VDAEDEDLDLGLGSTEPTHTSFAGKIREFEIEQEDVRDSCFEGGEGGSRGAVCARDDEARAAANEGREVLASRRMVFDNADADWHPG
jgi:hypothetical protein